MRYTQDQLLRWALSSALENRRGFISDKSVWSDESLRSETQKLIDSFEFLRSEKKRLRPRGETMRLACLYGEIDRQTHIETVCSQPHQAPDMGTEREMEMLAALHQLRQRAWGLTGLENGMLGAEYVEAPVRATKRSASRRNKHK